MTNQQFRALRLIQSLGHKHRGFQERTSPSKSQTKMRTSYNPRPTNIESQPFQRPTMGTVAKRVYPTTNKEKGFEVSISYRPQTPSKESRQHSSYKLPELVTWLNQEV